MVLAQAVATLGAMYPGRIPWIALGSGQAMNEAATGLPWPDKQATRRSAPHPGKAPMASSSTSASSGATTEAGLDSPIQVRAVETLSDDWYTLQKVTFEQARKDGSRQTLSREVYHNGPGAAVLPLDPGRGTVLLVRQFRIPAHVNGDPPMLVEACAGMVEEGDSPAETVRKELEQEMGYRVRDLTPVFTLYMSPGASAEKLHFFTAQYGPSDHVGRGGGVRGEGEEIQVLELPLSRAWEMVGAGEIVDAKTVLLLQHLRLIAGGGAAAR